MTNGRGFMKVKEWFFDKTNDAAKNFEMTLVGEYTDNETLGRVLDHTIFRVEEVLAETEKAIKVALDAETFGGNVKTWTTWVPKSVIEEM